MRLIMGLGVASAIVFATSKVLIACAPTDCTDIGCSDGVELELVYTSYDWPDGDYRIEVGLDDAQHVCSLRFPAERAQRDQIHPIRCEPDATDFELGIRQDYEECFKVAGVDAGTRTCAPAGERHRLSLRATGQPKTLHLRIERDGEMVAEKEAPLEYERVAPNGAACGPVCMSSQSEVQLD